jgi:hypothetical protein
MRLYSRLVAANLAYRRARYNVNLPPSRSCRASPVECYIFSRDSVLRGLQSATVWIRKQSRVSQQFLTLSALVLVEEIELAGDLEDLALVVDHIVAPHRFLLGTAILSDRTA